MKPISAATIFTRSVRTLLLLTLVFAAPVAAMAKVKTKWITINTESGCVIYVNGQRAESNPAEVKIEAYKNAIVRVEKPGYITIERNYLNDGDHEIPKEDFFKLDVDEAVQNSSSSDMVNHDVNVKTTMKEDDAWKMISHIVTSGFDVIDVSDKSAGYLRTGWVVNNYNSCVIRTRMIIKTGSTSPLVYRAKLISEIGKVGSNVNQDDAFKPWDRVLRSYEGIISDLQSRLMK